MIDADTEHLKRVERAKKIVLGNAGLMGILEELKDFLTHQEKKDIQSFKNATDTCINAISAENRGNTQSKIEAFNAISRCYSDIGEKDKASQTIQKRDGWLEKYNLG